MTYYLISFDSTHQAIKAEGLLKQKDHDFRVIPTPGEVTAGCGLTIKIEEVSSQIIEMFTHESVTWESLHQVTVSDGKKRYTELSLKEYLSKETQ